VPSTTATVIVTSGRSSDSSTPSDLPLPVVGYPSHGQPPATTSTTTRHDDDRRDVGNNDDDDMHAAMVNGYDNMIAGYTYCNSAYDPYNYSQTFVPLPPYTGK